MKHPHPIVSDGKKENALREQVRRVTKPIFEEVAKETQNNHVSVGGVGSSVSFYNPHNARYYFSFCKKTFSPKGSGGSVLRSINMGSEFLAEDFEGCRIVVKKKLIEVTNKVDRDRVFKISGSAKMRKELVVDALVTLEGECVNALRSFVKVFGGVADFVPVKVWIPDNKILHDRLVDSVPSKIIFRNEVVKKVYNTDPKNVEFSDPVFASNYFRNSGLFDFSPEIASGLDRLFSEVSLVKSFTYTPLKESLLLRISEAFFVKDWVCLFGCLRELLVLDSVLYGELKPLVDDVVLINS